MSINRVTISGNLTRDPEIRNTQSGMTVMSFGVAANDRIKNNQTGEWEDRANFIDCTMFGNRAESISQYLSKGSKVTIDGKLRWSQWEKDGQKRSKIDVIIDNIDFTSNASKSSNHGAASQGYQQPNGYQPNYYVNPPQSAYNSPYAAPTSPAVDAARSVYDEDIPF